MLPMLMGLSYLIAFFWRRKIIEKLKKGELKMLHEYMYAFYILKNQIRAIANQK